MTVDEILAEVEKLPAEEKMHLVETLGKRASCAAMGEFWVLHRAMRECPDGRAGGNRGRRCRTLPALL